MSQRLKIAFVGIDNPHGFGWRQLLTNFADDVEITAILPGFGGATTSLEESLVNIPRFDTVEQLIEHGTFDAAIVCLPNDENPNVVTQLANANKHILTEKPVGGCADDVKPLIPAIANAGVAFQSGYMWRYDDLANRLRDMIAEDRFGKLISVEMTFVTSDVQRRGPDHYLFDRDVSQHGFFNWLACHYIDLLQYVTDRKVTSVTARCGQFGGVETGVEDGGVVIFDLEGGAVATFIGGYWLPRWAGESRWCLRGTERWVHWDPARPGTGGALEIHGPKPQWIAMEDTFVLPPDETVGYGGSRAVALVRDWMDAIRGHASTCRNTPESTWATLHLIDAIFQSSKERRTVDIEW